MLLYDIKVMCAIKINFFLLITLEPLDAHQLTYKVAIGACLGLATLMLFTLVSVRLCFLINCQRRISQGIYTSAALCTLEIDRAITIILYRQSVSVIFLESYLFF